MIHELALFEKSPDEVRATEASLAATLTFAPSPDNPHPEERVAKALLLTVGGEAEGEEEGKEEVAGMAIYFHNYSTWTSAPGVYLEDLFIRPQYRRRGYATLLFGRLGLAAERVAGSKEMARLEWSCLKWNEGALKFYERIGGRVRDDWVTIRVEGEGGFERLRGMAESVEDGAGSA